MHLDELNALLFWYMDGGHGSLDTIPQFSQGWYNNLSDAQRHNYGNMSKLMAMHHDMADLCRQMFTFAK